MFIIKSLITGIMGVSFCMANISGIVTDTGTIPLSGAVVRLEKGGLTATTGPNGRFTLAANSAVLTANGASLTNSFFVRISGTMLNVSIAEQSAVEITTFDLIGKALSTVRRTLDAGGHSISLPDRGVGIYLYTVKSGNKELVLKGNSVGGASSGSAVSSQGSSINPLAKQIMRMTAINDVIAATKTGYLNYRVVVYNSDTSNIQIKMIICADTVRDIDGNMYQAVRIGSQVWMTENLRVTKYNDDSYISMDTSTNTWSKDTTPKYCFYNNTTNSETIKKFGALYNWFVVSPANPKNIAPTGWHVPTDAEWDSLQNYLISNGYNWDNISTINETAKSLSVKTDWMKYTVEGTVGCDLTKNNKTGFSAFPGGYRDNIFCRFTYQDSIGYWWSATKYDASYAWERTLWYSFASFNRGYTYKNSGISVRLVRD